MSYAPPTIGPAGLVIPQYSDVLGLFLSNFQAIYGPGVYLGTDSADYQFCSVMALAWSDMASAVQLDYNNRSPVYAVGAALDAVVAYNGLVRKSASYSTCTVTLTGTAGTIVTNGKVRDSVPGQGYLWDLPPTVTIGVGGTTAVSATCEVIGAVAALAGQIGLMATPTSGWTSVTNAGPASLGQPVETDSQLRTRQAVSTELPSITMLAGTVASVSAVSGVTRLLILENPTGSAITTWPLTSSPTWYGPAHSLTSVVEGGAQLDVATAIYENRGIGCATNGTTAQNVIDPYTGQAFTVNFYLPTYVPIYVTVNTNSLSSAFTATTKAAIAAAVTGYLNNLSLGGTVSWSALFATAMSAAGNLEKPIYDITTLYVGLASTPTGVIDLAMTNPWDVAQGLNDGTHIVVN